MPNKEFITGRLVNWTLSDTVLRIIVDVGVAYGSDIDKVRATLLRVAEENQDIMKTEKVVVVFKQFGNSSLNFSLRVYISSISFFIKVTNDLHCAIDKAFRQEGIEIAFPQQDIHIRSIKGRLQMDKEA